MKVDKTPAIAQLLREELTDGKYPAGTRFPSESDLAERFGINKITANRIVSALVADGLLMRCGRGSGTRVIKEEIFPKGQIAFIAPLPAHHIAHILHGASDYALHRRYAVTPFMPPANCLNRYMKLLPGSPFKGILASSYDVVDAPGGIPVIHVDLDFPESDRVHHAVNSENYESARQMMRKALEAGHREIVLFASDITETHGKKTINGYLAAMREAGIPNLEKRIFRGFDWSQESINRILKQILKAYPRLTLLATESDNDVIQLRTAFLLHAPEYIEKVVMIGLGNHRGLAKCFDYPTIDQHLTQLGALAAEKLISILENGEPEEPIREYVPSELVNTGSLSMKR